MADQKRWFKLWVSAPCDDAIQILTPAQRWAWAAFGCYTKTHGDMGTVIVSAHNRTLAAEMGVSQEELISTIRLFPNMHVEESENSLHSFIVTWENWKKYQEDSTVADRMRKYRERKTLRSKRRGEERRREEKRIRGEETLPQPGDVTESQSKSEAEPLTVERLVELYNELTPNECPAVETISPARREKARKYLKIFPQEDFWRRVFAEIGNSPFLRGLRNGQGHQSFVADLDWLLTKGKDGTENCVKTAEGKYRDG